MSTAATDQLTWDPPGPGSWTLMADHYPRPITATHRAFMEIWSAASTEWAVDIGLPIDGMVMKEVNGFPYMSVQAGGGSGKPPPAWVMSVMVRLVPSLRRAQRTLTRTLDERPWVEGVAHWYDHERPQWVERLLALARTDLDALDNDAIAAHLGECHRTWVEAAGRHIALGQYDFLPVCLFVAAASDLGIDPVRAFGLLRGGSPVSTGGSDELDRLRAAVAGRKPRTLEELRALGPDVSEALDQYLDHYGWRLADGYDIDGPCIAEVSSLVVHLATSHRPVRDETATVPSLPEVPAEARVEFERQLSEARRSYGLREDNGHLLISWATGLLRRAMLATGDRLVASGVLSDRVLAIEATPEELTVLLSGGSDVDEAELRRRAQYRASIKAADAPRALGPPEPPPPAGMPGALGKVMRAFEVAAIGEEPSASPLQGLGIGDAPYQGRVRLVLGAGEGIDTFEEGDVLVAPMTSPSYNAVLSLAGALVTDAGGIVSHAAVMARELGLPAVVGAPGATATLRDGDLVLVDPARGTVRVVTPERVEEPA